MRRSFDEALDFDANFSWSHGFLAFAFEGKSMHEHAIAAMQKAVDLCPVSTLSLLGLAEAYALAGKREEAAKILDQMEQLSKQQYVTPYFRARVYAALGEQDEALNWLEAAYRERASLMAFLKIDPQLDNLRSDPRFQDLVRHMNFPP
jgi:tetratricopeptide (TPR) repeat protein